MTFTLEKDHIDEIITLGLYNSTVVELHITWSIPYQSAILKIVPKFHGSLIVSRTKLYLFELISSKLNSFCFTTATHISLEFRVDNLSISFVLQSVKALSSISEG
jgi:hypothetical protein